MNDSDIVERLQEWGMSDKEAKVYLSALEAGVATVTDISRRTRIFRTYCYDILGLLVEKGLVSSITRRGVQYFEAANPEKLIGLLEERKSRIRDILPELKGRLQTAAKRPQVEMFEGIEGLKSIHEDILAKSCNSYVVSGTELISKALGTYFDLYVKRRVDKGLPAKVISEDSPFARSKVGASASRELRSVRFSKKLCDKKTTIYLYGDKVALLIWEKNPFGVIIQSKPLYDTFLVIFNEFWNATSLRTFKNRSPKGEVH